MKTEYKTINTWTPKGLIQAERLQNLGWVIERSGMFHVVMKKEK